MKFSSYLAESAISLSLVALLVLILDPFGFMPSSFLMMIEVMLIVLFGIFASFVWHERVRDEREELHRMRADRGAFLAGSGVLLLAILYESFYHMLDSWLVVALVLMLLAKMVGGVYNRFKR